MAETWQTGTHAPRVDAFHRIDIQHFGFPKFRFVFFGVNAIYRTCVHTGGVFCANARFSDYVSHIFRCSSRVTEPPTAACCGTFKLPYQASQGDERLERKGPLAKSAAMRDT